ncbi:hypothetical protein DB346_06100 [Verrucomicrobia bacterium LW23]|nr:hypothetical protein DB346_06100 [Verrucomicrobia bacterium LW23]
MPRNPLSPSNFWQYCLLAVLALSAAFVPAATAANKSKARAKKPASPSVGVPQAGTVQSSLSMDDAIQAKAALLYDATARKILWQRNISEPFAPASTTKLMTALLTYERFGTGGVVVVELEDTQVEPSSVPLKVGETVPIHDLLYSLLLGSDNDTAMALARTTGGSLDHFIDMMNARAAELGCRNTRFASPNGLPKKDQYTTAEDLLRIFQKVVSIPELRTIASTRNFVLRTKAKTETIKNHNRLLGVYPGMDAAKTGWTRASQHTYAASVIRDGRELQLIILQSPNKWVDARILLDYGFSTPATSARGGRDIFGRSRSTTPAPGAPASTSIQNRSNQPQRPIPRAEAVDPSDIPPPAPPPAAHAGSGEEIPRPAARGGGGGTPESQPDPNRYVQPGADEVPPATYRGPQSPEFSSGNSAPLAPAPTPAAPARPKQPEQKRRSYMVQSGDTLDKIAAAYNTTTEEILRINRIEDPENPKAGLTIIVPDNRK